MIDREVHPKLSICIATYKRSRFIGATLDSIVSQLSPEVEVVIVDGASPDDTPAVLAQYVQTHPELHYHREKENSGADCDFDKAVGYARGGYCWLMTDDDLLIPGAVQRVLAATEMGSDLIVVNSEVWNVDLTTKLESRRLNITTDQTYERGGGEMFFSRVANYLGFIGAVVIRRTVWLSRDRAKYYGSLFVHVGVIFQSPPIESVRVIADPLIRIRNGNAMWGPRSFEIWTFKWPQLLWSFVDFSNGVKQSVCGQQPWWRFRSLVYQRALGAYTLAEFQKYLAGYVHGYRAIAAYLAARFPATLANFIVVVYYCLMRRSARIALYDLLNSRNASVASRLVAWASGLKIS